MHLLSKHLPKHLEENETTPLIISGIDFTEGIYEAGMRISNGKELFFKRNEKIVYIIKKEK